MQLVGTTVQNGSNYLIKWKWILNEVVLTWRTNHTYMSTNGKCFPIILILIRAGRLPLQDGSHYVLLVVRSHMLGSIPLYGGTAFNWQGECHAPVRGLIWPPESNLSMVKNRKFNCQKTMHCGSLHAQNNQLELEKSGFVRMEAKCMHSSFRLHTMPVLYNTNAGPVFQFCASSEKPQDCISFLTEEYAPRSS